MPVSADDVRAAYRFILGRAPESEDLVAYYQARCADVDALRLAFFASEEARGQAFLRSKSTLTLAAPPQAIETSAPPEILRAILVKMVAYWEAIGETAPYWSVLALDPYTPDRFAKNQVAFFDSAKQDLDLLLALLHRIGRPIHDFQRCVEFGCGVGRVTALLAATFPKVVALDISRPHLRMAEAYLAQLGRGNVSFRQGTAEDPHPASGYDLWFSRLVLQHNPAPVNLLILDKAFAGLAPPRGRAFGGVAVVHVPTYLIGYSFNIAEYLTGGRGEEMEMHATPQMPILELAWHHGCCLLDVREENVPAECVTNFFVFQKVEDRQ